MVATVATACSAGPTGSRSTPPASAAPTTGANATATASAGGGAATPQASLDRVAGWQADIATIVPGLERLHPNPFHGTSKADMVAAATSLAENYVGLQTV